MSLIDKLKKATSLPKSEILSESKFFDKREFVPTSVLGLNIALGGELTGGLTSGLVFLAGPSKHFKTLYGLIMVKAYLSKYPDAVCIFYDSEFGTPKKYWQSLSIDMSRVLHVPFTDIEQLKFDIMQKLDSSKGEGITEKDKVIIFVDSVGNAASKKEVEDAINEKSVADMSRAKSLKSVFRIVTPRLTILDIPMVCINHTYQEIGLYPKNIMSGGCVVAGTEIIMADGSVKVIENIEVGDLVQTEDGPQRVLAAWDKHGLAYPDAECYEVEFSDGYKIICSENHKFKTHDGWKVISELSEDADILTVYEPTQISKIKKVEKQDLFDLTVENTNSYAVKNGVLNHNTGPMYSANTVLFIGKSQEKDGTEVTGFNFNITIEKSRFVKEKSKIPIYVDFKDGISPYSGLFDIALETGDLVKPKNGWYNMMFFNKETGELEQQAKSYRAAECDGKEFWDMMFKNTRFVQNVKEKYQLGENEMFQFDEGSVNVED